MVKQTLFRSKKNYSVGPRSERFLTFVHRHLSNIDSAWSTYDSWKLVTTNF